MKQKSIFTIFAAITMVLGFAMTGLSQQTGDVTANAQVLGALSVGSTQSLEFGLVSLAGPKTISLIDGASGTGSAGGIFYHGIFSVTKSTGTNVDLTFTVLPTILNTAPPSAATLPIGTWVAKWNANSTSGAVGTTIAIPPGTTTIPAANLDPIIYVHIGGTVTPDGTTTVDLYTGTITLQAVYN